MIDDWPMIKCDLYPQYQMQILNHYRLGWINRVFRLKIDGNIDQKLADSVARGLQNSWPYRPTALLVTINSPGGSLVQAKSISDLLKLYSNRYNVPIVTFVEDQCLGSANLLLTSGVKCYASNFSLIGDVGVVWSRLWYHKFAEKYDIKQEYIFAGENKVKFNQFEEIKPESEKWVKNYIYQIEHELKVGIIGNRTEHFTKRNLTKENIEEKVFNAGVIDPQQAVKIGLIDGVRNIDQEIKERYSTVPIKSINEPNKHWRQRLAEAF